MRRQGRSLSPQAPPPTEMDSSFPMNTIPTGRLESLESLMSGKKRDLQLRKAKRERGRSLGRSRSAVIEVEGIEEDGQGSREEADFDGLYHQHLQHHKEGAMTAAVPGAASITIARAGENSDARDSEEDGTTSESSSSDALTQQQKQQEPLHSSFGPSSPSTPFPLDLLFRRFSSTPLTQLDLSSWTPYLSSTETLQQMTESNGVVTAATFEETFLTDSNLSAFLSAFSPTLRKLTLRSIDGLSSIPRSLLSSTR